MAYRDDDNEKYDYSSDNEQLRRNRNKRPNSSRLQKRLKKREKREKRKGVLKGLGTFFIIALIIFIIVGTGIGIGMYTAVSTEIQDMNISDLALNHESFLMYTDKSGNARELEQIKSTINRKWVASEDIGDNLKMAAIAIEDQRFEKHHGVDIKRTLGATIKFALSKIGIGESDYGGSTITQQVIKNITNEKEKSSVRKIKEMMRAVALEKILTKDEILTMYLNIIYLANNCNGVEAASKMYFNKSADELSIAEAASIVGITQTPAKYDPYKNPENNIEKRNRVLKKMFELEMISEEEYDDAIDTPLKVVSKKNNKNNEISSYFADQVYNDVISDLQTIKGYSEDFATQQLTNGGLKIYTTIDPDIQEQMEKVFENSSNFPSSSAEAAMVVMDPYTGEVKGMVGGAGKKTDIRGLNRATQAKRQPGSSLKPLAVYAPAIELEEVDENTLIKDEQITIGNDNWKPSNSYKGFKGDMTVREAIGRSSNIPAVKVLEMVGINKSYSYLENNFRLSTLKSDDKNYSSLALGGLTSGVTVEEMAAAYSVFVNGGKYSKPITYTKVVDAKGNIILENTINNERAIKESTAFIISNLLSEPVNSSYGTARGAKLSGMSTFGKTGTTNDNFDKWFVGFTPYYVGAVWYGYDSPKSVGGSNPSVSLWKKVMQTIHENLEDKEFEVPAGVIEAEICMNNGKLARKSCDSETAYFVSGRQPRKTCSGHSSKSTSTTKPQDEDEENEEGDDEDEATKKPSSTGTAAPKKTATPKPTQAATEKPASTPQPEPENNSTGSVPIKQE